MPGCAINGNRLSIQTFGEGSLIYVRSMKWSLGGYADTMVIQKTSDAINWRSKPPARRTFHWMRVMNRLK